MERSPLSGLCVLDLSHIVAGPHCAMLLADAGADVVKIEPPTGEAGRERGVLRRSANGERVSAYFVAVNRGKRSLALDLKTDAGRATLWELICSADVLIESFRHGTMDRLGFGYEAVHSKNPALIYASIRAFKPEDADRASRGGLAIVAEGESGIASHCIDEAARPVWCGFPLGDFVTGLTAYGAITTALVARSSGGSGQHVPISMVSALMSMNSASVVAHEIDGPAGVQFAKDTAPYGFYRTVDGYITIAITMDKFWSSLCRLIERSELADDRRYQKAAERNHRVAEVTRIVEAWTARRTRDECIRALDGYGIPCGRVNDTSDLLADDGMLRSGYFIEVDDGIGGTLRMPANPFGISDDRLRRVPRLDDGREAVDVAVPSAR